MEVDCGTIGIDVIMTLLLLVEVDDGIDEVMTIETPHPEVITGLLLQRHLSIGISVCGIISPTKPKALEYDT